MTTAIAFVGGGNMTQALVSGLVATKNNDWDITISEPAAARREDLEAQFPDCRVTTSNALAADAADVIVLAVKPQVIVTVASALAAAVDLSRKTLISIAAGVSTQELRRALGPDPWIVRCMPNQPALTGYGMTGLYAEAKVPASIRATSEAIMRSCGATSWVSEETLIDAVTAISGSGPAYFYEFMDALIEQACDLGLERDQACQLVIETALGASMVAKQSDQSLATLRERVTSPGGTTEAALQALANDNLRAIVGRAAKAAYRRSQQLAKPSKE